jgi:diguanylate cyclase (GGDEF)-like protein
MTMNNSEQAIRYNDADIAALYQEVEQLRIQVNHSEQAVAELRHRSDIQEAQNQMLNISLLPISLENQLHKILLLILHIPWLALEEKGCIFLVDQSRNTLKMVVQHNLSDGLLTMCAKVPFGDCLCGSAANSQQLVFKNCLDADHKYRHEGMQPHGHYVLPIISSSQTLGVLNLYVKHGHQTDAIERDFLNSSGQLLAGIIERKTLEQKLHRLSYHDELTGLANRRHFTEYLKDTIKINQRIDKHFAVLFLDLDYFKAANDQHGHDYGDEVLITAARRMENCIRQTDLLARLGGDEFVACINLLNDTKYALTVGQKIQQAVSQFYYVKDRVIRLVSTKTYYIDIIDYPKIIV